jgi:hypothetical protein
MHNFNILAAGFAVILLSLAIGGCSDDKKSGGGSSKDKTAPTVTSVHPAADATDVALNTVILARFSEAMQTATITGENFAVTSAASTPVPGLVSYDESNFVASFLPSTALTASTVYTATVTTGVKDLAGNALASNYTWSFTTGATSDTTPPTVTSTNPADLATGVAVNHSITAVFSKELNAATVTSASFTLTEGGTPVQGTVSCPGTSAIFTPQNALASFATFTATLTTDIKDLAGNALEVEYQWAFQTGDTSINGPAPVALGTSGNFVILAKSAISTTGTTSIVGDLGLSPAAGSFFTGFSETMDATNEFATSPMVTGMLFAADYAPPTDTNLTSAVSDMQTAYADALGRSNPDFTELGAGNVDGMTLNPGLYKWGTSLEIPIGVTLSGGANDVWIFQIAGDLNVGDGAILTLSGGAQPKNIFWQVAGQATLGTTADFKGIVLCQTAIVLNTGAVMNGRALAQTAVTLDANAVTQP